MDENKVLLPPRLALWHTRISGRTLKVLEILHDPHSGNRAIVPGNEILMLTFWEAKEQ